MVCEMENDQMEDMDIEALSSMWPEDIDSSKPYVEKPVGDQDMLEEVTIVEGPTIVDFHHLVELTNYTDRGSSQLAHLVQHWEYKQANAVRLLREELDILSKQREEVELKKLEILEDFRFEEERYGGDKRQISILDEILDIYQDIPRRKSDIIVQSKRVHIDAEFDTVAYWKQRAVHLERLLEASVHREELLAEKLQESIQNLEKQSSPIEELTQILKRADNFLHFVLQNAPVVIGHQDKDLRYRFIYNHFPRLQEEEIIGKTDVEIFSGAGVKESQDFKKEVLDKGLPAKREITFETELFGSKTFLIYVEPVFSKSGETIGINYMGMDVTDQVRKREKMARLREEMAVQKAKETELNKTIHITEETMRSKQMLATMSHEIRSPLSGVVSMAEILSTTNLDREQRQLLNVMISSGDLTAAASLQKIVTLEGRVADDVPIEVIGDVLRIRQILTNLISNAIKFTHEGKVGINLYVVSDPCHGKTKGKHQKPSADQSTTNELKEGKPALSSQSSSDRKSLNCKKYGEGPYPNHLPSNEPQTPVKNGNTMDGDEGEEPEVPGTTVWLCCDVYDTGIGIPDNALPTLFKKYMQVSAGHARQYGGTGLGLAICKQLVELMGGRLTVSSKVKCGSTFTFVLPYKLSSNCDSSDDPDDLSEMADHDALLEDETAGFFQFQPRTLGSLFSSNGSTRTQKLLPNSIGFSNSPKFKVVSEDSCSFPSGNVRLKETTSAEDACSMAEVAETLSEPESSFSHSPDSVNENVVFRRKKCLDDTRSQIPNGTANCNDHTESSKEVSGPGSCKEQEKSAISSSIPQEPEPKPKPKILLVEDNKINVMVTKSMMKRLGHTMDVVSNGVEAVRAVQSCSYDLILMDVCMPVMNGLQATQLIRSFEETGNWDAAIKAGIEPRVPSPASVQDRQSSVHHHKRIPIIAMTANALSESAEECYANGMDSFVSKPATFQKIKECLEQYLP
ncbi:HISTIDINE KINASE CYTOKININ RECEPTOR [Salix purpurea]|uniref:histidine kinase n=1 Tax=Salix purpurea TaxID=77065 RepID=A0A9Q0Q0B8_SALPP|nr:HISTIDINE KINASE CYTOKININ RECEPTOR [Salix purpurea]